MLARTPSFRDFTCFTVFLLIWSGLVEQGWGQQQRPAPAQAPVSQAAPASAGASLAAKPSLERAPSPRTAPLVQTPDFRSVISVGRTLSSVTVSGVANNTLTVTYSVYNLRPDPLFGALLTTTLKPGVTFQSATPAPDRNGQQLAFSLGAIAALGSVTAQLTVTLATGTTQIDGGSAAFAYWNGLAVGAGGLAATLRTGTVDSTLLQSTLNANLTDNFVTGQAAALGNDPNRIFQFVRDQIGYESYTGALRGARGTLWSMAGNSLDKASLLVALLRASGIPARYVSGTLPQAQAKQLILSMFPPLIQLTGYVASGATLSDPVNDPNLQAEAQAHYWVEFDAGAGFVDADPDFAGATIGQTFAAPAGTFTDVPSNLNHTVTVKLNVELYQEGLFGPITSTVTPLTQTFTSAELVGHPLTLGHLVQQQTSGFVITATTNTYTPYLTIGQDTPTLGTDPLITGQQYQELLTNFPFSSQVVTGIFLETDVSSPGGNTVTDSRALLDRIGYAARQGLIAANVQLPSGSQLAVTPFDVVTISAESSLFDIRMNGVLQARDDAVNAQGSALPALGSQPDPVTLQAYNNYLVARLVGITRDMDAAFRLISNGSNLNMAVTADTKSYFDSPRIVLSRSEIVQSGNTSGLVFALDLRKDTLRAIAFPGQDLTAASSYQTARGYNEGLIERNTLQSLSPGGASSFGVSVSAFDILTAAQEQNIDLLTIDSSNVGTLSNLELSADAKARISDAVNRGRVVAVPAQSVTMTSGPAIAWYELDPTSGFLVDTTEDGGHQGIVTWSASEGLQINWASLPDLASFKNNLNSFNPSTFLQQAKKVLCQASGGVAVVALIAAVIAALKPKTPETVQLTLIIIFMLITAAAIYCALPNHDPVVPPALTGVPALSNPGLNASAAGVKPNVTFLNVSRQGLLGSGAVQGQIQASSLRATNQISATWSSNTTSAFQIGTITSPNATITNSSNQTVGTGAVAMTLTSPAPATITGSVNYSVTGNGDLSFYGPATSAIGASGNWTAYSATLTGSPAVSIMTNSITLNGSALPLDTYTITGSSISAGGSGQTTSPNFAGSASLTVTSGAAYIGPGSGSFTSGGGPIPAANGITLDGFTGTIGVTGNGLTDGVDVSGTAANVLAVTPSPASFQTNENTPVTFGTPLLTSLSDTYTITAEAPPGWSVNMDATGNVTATPAPGLQGGTYPIFVTATSQTDPNLVAQAPVLITLGPTAPGMKLTVTPDSIFSVPVNGAQLSSAFRAMIQNTGPAADTYNLTFSNISPGFTILDSETSATVPAGSTAVAGIYLTPIGNLPPPNTQASFMVTATSASNPAITASQTVSFTVPAIQAVTLTPAPAALTSTPGTPANSSLTVQSVGNVAASVTLTSSTQTGISLSGLPSSLTLNPGQSSVQNLILTAQSGAPLDTLLAATITASAGTTTATATVSLELSTVQAQSAAAGAAFAAGLGRTDIASTLSNLSAAIDSALSACTPAAQQQVLAYVNNLIQEMNAPFLAGFVAPLQAAAAAISSATCANIGAALTQLSAVLTNLASVLNSPAAFPFSFELTPNTALAIPGQTVQFPLALQNQSTATNTYTLTLNPLPAGVTGSLSTTTVTLAPGASLPASGGPYVSISPSTGLSFQFSVTAVINGVAGSGQTAYGTMTARNTFLSVEDVTPTPRFTNTGGKVDVAAHIADLVNTNKTVQVTLTVKDASNNTKATVTEPSVQLSVQSLVTTVDFGLIDTTGFANGNYTLAVAVIDPVTNSAMPGGTGTGTLLIGSPVTASLTVKPTTLAPGNATVTSTLNVSLTSTGGGSPAVTLIGSANTASGGQTVAVNGSTAYQCDNNEISVINVANPAAPALVGAFGPGGAACDIQRGDLVALTTGNSPGFFAYDLTNATSPSLIASTGFNKIFTHVPFYMGNYAFFNTIWILFGSGFPGPVTDQAGDFVAMDVTNFSSPSIVGTLENPSNGMTIKSASTGGPFNVYGLAPYSSSLAFVTSTTSQGAGDPQTGAGQLWVVNTTNPAAMSIVKQVNVPGTLQVWSPLVQGNTLVTISDTGGWTSPTCCSPTAFSGNVVVTVFDITNPQSPQITANVTTSYLPGLATGASSAVIGPHLFLYGGVRDSSNNIYFLLVDTTDPTNPVISTIQTPSNVYGLRVVGSLLYAASDTGLLIYSIPGSGVIQYTASVQIANNGAASYNANSFSVPPTSTVTGTGFDTVSWTNPPSNTITWTSNITGIQPGQVIPVDLGGSVNFTVPLGSGVVPLVQADVSAGQILSLSPSTQTVAPGVPATYTVTVNNPTAAAMSYNLSVAGVAPNWVNLPASVNVPANSQTPVTLTLRSEVAAAAGTFNFMVNAASGGSSASVGGTFILQGVGVIGPVTSTNAYGVSASLIPISAIGGQGTPAQFIVQITNSGDVTDTYSLSVTAAGNINAVIGQSAIQVPPGLTNFRQTTLTLTAAQGTPPGPLAFTLNAASMANANTKASAAGTLNVVSNGVGVTLSPPTGPPGTTFVMTIANKGTVTDTFALAIGGPASAVATLASSAVTLAPGTSQNVNITTGAGSAFVLGSLELLGQATSQGNSSVKASGTAVITIAPRFGMTASFNPASQFLPAPGPATFILSVANTGTVQDTYSASIVSTTGSVTASLVGLDGNPTQSIPVFLLPGVSQGQLVLKATLTGLTPGSVTVKISSLTSPGETVLATATLGLNKPISNAGKNRNILKNAYTLLDGSDSADLGGNRLTYKWTVVSVPATSLLNQSGLGGSTTPRPFFDPDMEGQYVFQLVVNNGISDSAPSQAVLTAYNNHVPPNANAGKPVNARRGSPATVNGSLSLAGQPSHPNKPGPISYLWTVKQAPSGSKVSNSSITNNTQAVASLVPDVDGVFVLTLTVFDSNGSSSDDVTVTAAEPDVPPNAVAGKDRRILLNTPVTLDGTGANDADSGPQPLSYQWRFVSSASDSAITSAATATPRFTPVSRGFYVVRLDVSDGAADSFDQMTVMASSTCDANADGVVTQIDLDLMNALVGQNALTGDPLDVDHDGLITDNDVAICSKQVSGPHMSGVSPVAELTETGASTAAGTVLSNRRPAVSDIRDAASLQTGAIAPGEILLITGTGFGGPASFDARVTKRIPTTLSGVQVLFDGVAAPLLYVTPTQLSAVAPHTLDAKSRTTIVVTNGNDESDAMVLPVSPTVPAIFTADGTPQAIAENQDGSLNSAANPAAAGSVITLFFQGAGQTVPRDMEGTIVNAGEQIRPQLTVRVFLGEAPAEVLSASSAPGTISGVMRVQVRIPPGTPANPATPVRIVVGSSSSQPGVVLAIR